MTKTYILNAPVVTDYGIWDFKGPLTISEAKHILKDGFTSAVGHKSTADFLCQRLGIKVPVNRVRVHLQPGDQALVTRLLVRLEEGKLMSLQDIQASPFELGLLIRLS